MSNTTYPSLPVKPVASVALDLLRELFKATPLYIFVTAAKSAFGKTTQR